MSPKALARACASVPDFRTAAARNRFDLLLRLLAKSTCHACRFQSRVKAHIHFRLQCVVCRWALVNNRTRNLSEGLSLVAELMDLAAFLDLHLCLCIFYSACLRFSATLRSERVAFSCALGCPSALLLFEVQKRFLRTEECHVCSLCVTIVLDRCARLHATSITFSIYP